ncbi:MAG TPA: prolipoprotein diacylglyceryl transferase family protein, partial [Actinomycetota bacterium]|nr:prolipoprotein diacylglyceryl transferase family protein [Actinomycetota bacterium]
LAGAGWMVREGRKRGLSEDHVGTILVWALVGAIFGARFFYVIGHFSEFDGFVAMLAVWRGGISLIGGIVGAMIFAYPFMRKYGYRFLQVMDSAAIGLAFGIALGRIGDLVIGDHLGKPTSWALAWVYQGGQLAGYDCAQDLCRTTLANGDVQSIGIGTATTIGDGGRIVAEGIGVHQTAFYDLFIALGLFLFLFWFNRKPRREGVLIMAFAIWYGTGRIITDMLRVDKEFFGLTGSQWTSIAAIVLSVITLVRYAMRPGPGPVRQMAAVGATGNERPTTEFEPPEEPKG